MFCPECGRPTSGEPDAREPAHDYILGRLRAPLERIHHMRVLRLLGRGGQARVYLARDLRLDRDVALKVMSAAAGPAADEVRRFQNEGMAIARLKHPGIVGIYGIEEIEDLLLLSLEYLDGGSLADRLRSGGTLDLAAVSRIACEVGAALQHAHDRGILHRDVKPGNILFHAESGSAVVSDFGLAKQVEATGHSRTGALMGTPAYMSPEQCRAEPATARSDQYALGIVLWEMLAGRAPFRGSEFEMLSAHLTTPVPSLTERRADCPPEAEHVIRRMLAKSPDDRWPSVDSAVQALAAVLVAPSAPAATPSADEGGESAPEPLIDRPPDAPPERPADPVAAVETEPMSGAVATPPPASPPAWRRRRTVVAAAAISLIALAGLQFSGRAGSGSGDTPAVPSTPLSIATTMPAGSGEQTPPVDTLSIRGWGRRLRPGDRRTAYLHSSRSGGTASLVRGPTWRIGDPSVATVDQASGELRARAAGLTTLEALLGDSVVAGRRVVVGEDGASVRTIDVRVEDLFVGDTVRLTPQGFDADGQPVMNLRYDYKVVPPHRASVNETGVLVGLSAGAATLYVVPDGGGEFRFIFSVVPRASRDSDARNPSGSAPEVDERLMREWSNIRQLVESQSTTELRRLYLATGGGERRVRDAFLGAVASSRASTLERCERQEVATTGSVAAVTMFCQLIRTAPAGGTATTNVQLQVVLDRTERDWALRGYRVTNAPRFDD